MKISDYAESLKKQTGLSKLVIYFLFVSVAVNLLLAIKVFTSQDRVREVIVPPSFNKSFWVDDQAVSKEYLEQMSMYFAHLLLDLSPGNAEYQQAELLKYVDPESYGQLSKELTNTTYRLKQVNASTWFAPSTLDIDEKHKNVKINGIWIEAIGDQISRRTTRSFEIQYVYKGGKLLIKSLADTSKASDKTPAFEQEAPKENKDQANSTVKNGNAQSTPNKSDATNTPPK